MNEKYGKLERVEKNAIMSHTHKKINLKLISTEIPPRAFRLPCNRQNEY